MEMVAASTAAGQMRDVDCNETCCRYSNGDIRCYAEYNYTDFYNLTSVPQWELGVRWTFASLVLLVGVLGNLCVIIILLKNRLLLRTSVNHFILNMSVADLILAIAGPVPFTIRDTHTFWPLGEVWCHLEGYIQMLVMLVSVTSLATISCDRMVGVVRPFHQHLKKWQSSAIIAFLWASSAVLAVPWYINRIYTVRAWRDMTQTICGEPETMHTWWVVAVIGLTWLPLAVMVVSFIVIFVYFKHPKLRASSRMGAEHPVMVHLKHRVLKMMFVVVLIFAVCWLPFQLLKIFDEWFLDENGMLKDSALEMYNDLMTVAQYMIYINPAVNPIVYALMHQTFRRAFRVTFSCFFKSKSSLVLTKGQGASRYVWSVKCAQRTTRVSQEDVGASTGPAAGCPTPQKNRCCVPLRALCPRHSAAPRHHKSVKKKTSDSATVQHSRGSPSINSCYADEGFVPDLPRKKMSVMSKGALGHLINEVIEEESSSEAERERIL